MFENVSKGEFKKLGSSVYLEKQLDHETTSASPIVIPSSSVDREQAESNAEFISYCFNLQQKYDIGMLEECVKQLEADFKMCNDTLFPTESELREKSIDIKQLLTKLNKL